jgi:protein gp37
VSDKTGIEWTDATWNPIRGCSRVSEGCRNCYAEGVAHRFSGPGKPYEGLVTIGADGLRRRQWNGQIKFVEEHLLDPLKWKPVKCECQACGSDHLLKDCEIGLTRSRRIFVNSMSDLFHENVTNEMLDRIFAVMALCPQHTFQVLTKRPERMLAYLSGNARASIGLEGLGLCLDDPTLNNTPKISCEEGEEGKLIIWPLPNVWLGVSVENQKAADERLDYLCELASQGWQTMVSFEPLLSAVDPGEWWLSLGQKTWAIVGGESGPGARPMHPDWARSLRDQCVVAGVPFFFKQWGEWAPGECVEANSGTVRTAHWFNANWNFSTENLANDEGHRDDEPDLYRVGKKAAGHLLDGKEWHQFPAVRG